MSVRSLMAVATLFAAVGGITLTGAIAAANSNPQPTMQLAQSQPKPARRSRASWIKQLNLSPAQIQKIQEIRDRYQAQLVQQRQAVQQAQQELKQLMAGNASADQIRQKFDQVQALRQQLNDSRMESMIAIRNVLTPEQRQKLSEAVRQYGQNRRDRSNTPWAGDLGQ